MPPTRTATVAPVVLLGRTGDLQFQDENAVADQAVLIAAAVLAPPPGSQYEVWLVGDSQRQSLGILNLDSSGRGELIFDQEQGSNLIGSYSGVELSIESNPDTDPKSSVIVAYSFVAEEGYTHLRNLLVSFPDVPDQNALIQGFYADVATMDELAKEMQKASSNGNVDRAKLYAEGILNILVGNQSANRKDWHGDGQIDDPSDGYGLLLNGRNLGYLQASYIETDAARFVRKESRLSTS